MSNILPDQGSLVADGQLSINLQESDGSSDVLDAVVDRLGYQCAIITVAVGAASGSPSSYALAFDVVHGDESDGSDAAVFTDAPTIADFDTDNTIKQVVVDLSGAKRYVGVQLEADDSSFSGGSSPANDIVGVVLLCGEDNPPST